MNGSIFHSAKLFIIGILSLPGLAFADINGYIGAGVGQATLHLDNKADQKAIGNKVFIGADLLNILGIEYSQINLGKYLDDTVEIGGTALYGVARFSFQTGITVMARYGLFDWEIKYTTANSSSSGQDRTHGIGVAYQLMAGFSARIDYDIFRNVGETDTFSGNEMSLVSAGISFHF
ncbi:MAG: hypothetical protein OEY52_17225 [Gammaproteobacteria bacterium]|nr:hypothetical protein [Gammaproteobacteria bacterium]